MTPAAPQSLIVTVVEIERHVAELGWDQRPRLYALVDTAELMGQQPQLAALLESTPGTAAPGSLTPVEQDELADEPIDTLLAGIAWPPEVRGCALVQEVVVLPPSAERTAAEQAPTLESADWANEHPERRDVRLVVGVLRDGSTACALRLRGATDGAATEDDVLTGPDLAPNLSAALLATLD
ncbi:MAG: PPA1309 family protein [Mycobacteriales bacterium]